MNIYGYTIGNRIKLLREEKGLTQEDLAKLLTVKRPVISYWENGSRTPDIDALIFLADYFDVSLDYITGRQENKKNEAKGIYEKYGLTDKALMLLSDYKYTSKVTSVFLSNIGFYNLMENIHVYAEMNAKTTQRDLGERYLFQDETTGKVEGKNFRFNAFVISSLLYDLSETCLYRILTNKQAEKNQDTPSTISQKSLDKSYSNIKDREKKQLEDIKNMEFYKTTLPKKE